MYIKFIKSNKCEKRLLASFVHNQETVKFFLFFFDKLKKIINIYFENQLHDS